MKKMKTLIYQLVFFSFISCGVQHLPEDAKADIKTSKTEVANDDEKWDVIVFDPQYETYILSVARPISMFTDAYLRSRNQILVSEWNSRYYSGRNPNFYEVAIDYDPNEDYGIEFNYRIYQFFGFLNWRYGVKFNGLSMMDRRK